MPVLVARKVYKSRSSSDDPRVEVKYISAYTGKVLVRFTTDDPKCVIWNRDESLPKVSRWVTQDCAWRQVHDSSMRFHDHEMSKVDRMIERMNDPNRSATPA